VSSDDAAPDDAGRRDTWWSATVQWRNWPLLVKLGMVLVVPVVAALALGVLRVKSDVDLADSYDNVERIAIVRVQLVHVLSALLHERNEAVREGADLRPAAGTTDAAVAAMARVVRQTPDFGSAAARFRAVQRALDSLPLARRQATSNDDGFVVLSAYNAVTDTVTEFDRSLVGRFPDENLASTSNALSELQELREQVGLEQAVVNLGLRDHGLSDTGRQSIVEAEVRLDDKLTDFGSLAPPELEARYENTVTGQQVTTRQQLVDAARTTVDAELPFAQEQWTAASDATTARMANLTTWAANDLRAKSNQLAETVSDRAGLESVLLLLMVLLAAGVGGGLGRYLLRSVGLLRNTALEVANERLPAAVASIRAGDRAKVTVDPVPLRTTEEFGQLARAFDAVHDQAVRSAGEEASLRSNLANIFTNLSRRSQGLVERQLRLMEQLEQKTDDPDQLANLFKIDHLATRMRRNNENLMVLSGTGLLRRFTEPMPLPDVLRAAISEVEHYQRAIVRSPPEVRIAGYAAGDLIRSVSELIENATAFSPPIAQVVVSSRVLRDGSAIVDILDQGVGMGEVELTEANHRVAGGGGVDVPISRQMGLFVVGRLTARHSIQVRLVARAEGGLCASVLVPSGLVSTPVSAALTPAGADSPTVAAPAEIAWPAIDTSWPADAPTVVGMPPIIETPAPVGPTDAPVPVSVGVAAVTSGAAMMRAPAEVVRMLESAGIIVQLPELPAASTPASILFAPHTPVEPNALEPASRTSGGFTWLNEPPRSAETPSAEPAPAAAPVIGPNGLPKRVPKGQISGQTRGQQPQPATTRTRDAVRARGFLNGFQAGIRRSETGEGETGS
jgi:signal transduction histidine kinase